MSRTVLPRKKAATSSCWAAAGAAASAPRTIHDAGSNLFTVRPPAAIAGRGSWPLRSERLIGKRRARRPLDHDERPVRALMAGVAGGSEIVVGGDEAGAVAPLDRALDFADGRHDGAFDHLTHRHVLILRKVLDHVLEAFLQFVDLVVRQITVADIAGEPELGVPDLRHDHDVGEPRCIGPFRGIGALRARIIRRSGKGEKERGDDRPSHAPPFALASDSCAGAATPNHIRRSTSLCLRKWWRSAPTT